jgi:hypothetical protein
MFTSRNLFITIFVLIIVASVWHFRLTMKKWDVVMTPHESFVYYTGPMIVYAVAFVLLCLIKYCKK